MPDFKKHVFLTVLFGLVRACAHPGPDTVFSLLVFDFDMRFFSMCLVGRPGGNFCDFRAVWGMVFAVFVGQKDRFYDVLRVFVLLTYRNYILQHGQKCVNTIVFARHWHTNTANTVTFAAGNKNIVNTVVLGFRSAKKHWYLHVFFALKVSNIC